MSVGAVALRCALHRLRAGRVVLALACLAAALVAAGQCASLVSSLAWYVPGGADDYTALLGQGNGLVAGLGDFLAYLVLGRAQPAPSSGVVAVREVMQIPFGWLVCVLLPVVVTALLAGSEGGRAPVLVASGSRVGDWLGRCLATLAGCALVWAALVLVCSIATLALGGELTLRASEWFCDVAAIARETLTAPPYEVGPAFAGAVVVSGALSLVQLAVAELVGPRPAFLVVAAVVSGSIFLMTPALPGNLMMLARSSVFVVSRQVEVTGGLLQAGIEPWVSYVMAVALAAIALVAGAVVAGRRSYLGSDVR